jgi:hypothetical protein
LLTSEEFVGKYKVMHPDRAEHPSLNSKRRTIVLIHLQKTAGTSLRQIIGQSFPLDRRCPVFEDRLHALTAAELGHYDFFSGHFDISATRLIPRDCIETVTVFREPRSRLVSLYRFLKSHPIGDEFSTDPLVPMAHALSPEQFFERSEVRDFPMLNNHYLFALGRSYAWFNQNRGRLSSEMLSAVLLDAKIQVHAMSALGLTERFDESVRLICKQLRLPEPSTIPATHVTDRFIDLDKRFRRVDQVEMTPRLYRATEDLTFYDSELYRTAVAEFTRRTVRAFGAESSY